MAQGLPCSKEKENFSLSGFLLRNTRHQNRNQKIPPEFVPVSSHKGHYFDDIK